LLDYFEILLQNDGQITCSYLLEQIESYVDNLNRLYPMSLNPSLIQKITKQTDELLKLSCLSQFHLKIKDAVSEFNRKYQPVKNALNGKLELIDSSDVLYFPVLENDGNNNHLQSGFLETIKVEIKEAKAQTNFYISPSGREIEKLISEQIETSWNLSIEQLKKYVRKFNIHHDVFIHFNNKSGYYTGNSLGAALSLVFLKELLSYYNAPIIFSFNGRIAVTGGLDSDENILEVSEDILEKKVVTAFFSTVQTFVVADNEKQFASEKLNELKQDYPNRNLKIIGVEDLDDLLARRNVVKIRKQKAIVRSAKFALKNWAAVLFLAMVLILVYVGRFYDFDDNPAILVNKGFWLSVQNKNGKELWKKRMRFSSYVGHENQLNYVAQKIIDVDNDGTNEVILSLEDRHQYTPILSYKRVACFSSKGILMWEYTFKDSISSIEQDHSLDYATYLIDTLTINKTKSLALFAQNVLYPTAVFFLDLKTGKRIDTTMWHVGHLHSGIFKDLNQDGKLELIMTGLNNSLGRVVIFSVDIDKIGGQLPAIGDRMFKEMPIAEVNNYILLPKSDYTSYFGLKFNQDSWGAVNAFLRKNITHIFLNEGQEPDYKGITVFFNKDLSVNKIDISEGFEVARDALVESRELQPPYSNTKEYINILFEQIRFWDGTKFVTKEENYKRVLSGKIMK